MSALDRKCGHYLWTVAPHLARSPHPALLGFFILRVLKSDNSMACTTSLTFVLRKTTKLLV